MDIYQKQKRSDIMSQIFGKETKPEILVRKFLFANGFRFRKNVKDLPGKPDIVLPKYNTVIFIHGCFWHGHICKRGALPETYIEFWKTKIGGNIERDKRNVAEFKKSDWNIIVLWGCELKTVKLQSERLELLVKEILSNS